MPVYKKLREILDSGKLGKVNLITMNFGSFKEYNGMFRKGLFMEENRDVYRCGTENESRIEKGISSIIESRRSIRKYTDQEVGHDQIEEIMKAASWAPSAKNRQPF